MTDADLIKDFTDGSDAFGLADGLTFSDLTIEQGSGSHSSHTIISKTSSSEYLAIIENIAATKITMLDMVSTFRVIKRLREHLVMMHY